ncbi:MAG TPA: extensin family protein [Polyangiaceae bacterium]|nr:extensin family protein [Polyangiaceae bacterium]
MVTPERRHSLRQAFEARREQTSRAAAALAQRIRREAERAAVGARRAAACFAFASGCVGAWVFGVWCIGAFVVYAEAAGPGARVEPGAPPAAPGELHALAPRDGPPDEGAPEIETVAGRDGEPLVPRTERPYPLDGRSRTATPGVIACPSIELVDHAGDGIAFEPPARVTPPFRERLRELERVLREVSLPFYGRAPSALIIASSYDCRSISGRGERLSEHALGNAIDITGFRFAALDAASAPGFDVRIDRHWNARGDATRELHARFLQALTQALIARDVFRTLLGPAHRDHADHFHFDMAPHYYVDL